MTVTFLHSIREVRERVRNLRANGFDLGLVPTMGALHKGHAALIRQAGRECDRVIVSLFVNPLQFGPGEDFERYPRSLPEDLRVCEEEGVDTVFAPSVEEMYPRPMLSSVRVDRVSDHLCGRSRPGHFQGVTTVVSKLFHIVQPDRAYFGQKDSQQLAVIRRMVEDLNLPVQIVAVETVRECDGLAVSSRNAYLNSEERKAAPALFQSLQMMCREIEKGETNVRCIREIGLRKLQQQPLIRVEYLEVVDPEEMQPQLQVKGAVLVAGAIRIGSTRLIDNLPCRPEVASIEGGKLP